MALHLDVHGQRKVAPDGVQGRAQDVVVDAVVHGVEEADVAAGGAHLGGQLPPVGGAGRVEAAHVDLGDGGEGGGGGVGVGAGADAALAWDAAVVVVDVLGGGSHGGGFQVVSSRDSLTVFIPWQVQRY